MSPFKAGSTVYWSWGDGTAEGKVTDIFTENVVKTIKGTDVKRNASDDDPAYLIEQADGSEVLKGHSELSLTK